MTESSPPSTNKSNISSDKSSSSVIDQSLLSENPGSYEDLHKKTKGSSLKFFIVFFFFNFKWIKISFRCFSNNFRRF